MFQLVSPRGQMSVKSVTADHADPSIIMCDDPAVTQSWGKDVHQDRATSRNTDRPQQVSYPSDDYNTTVTPSNIHLEGFGTGAFQKTETNSFIFIVLLFSNVQWYILYVGQKLKALKQSSFAYCIVDVSWVWYLLFSFLWMWGWGGGRLQVLLRSG